MRHATKILILSLLIVLHIPKQQVIVDKNIYCDCYGMSYGSGDKRCIGIPFSCEEQNLSQDLSDEDCRVESCSAIRQYMGFEGNGTKVRESLNLMFLLDTSLSMKGERIAATKAAAKKLVNEMAPEDRSAVITFNTESELVHSFSSDRQGIIRAIDEIEVKGDTRYLEALKMAQRQFEYISGHKILIFLSDGDPLDNTSIIFDKAEEMKKEGIEIYTISFGELIKTDVIKRMASTDFDEAGYMASIDVYDSFKRIYEAVQEREKPFMVEPAYNISSVRSGRVNFAYRIYSDEGNIVPGVFAGEDEIYCVEEARARLIFRDEEGNEDIAELIYNHSYYMAQVNLEEGNYSVFINLSVGLDNCSYGASIPLEPIIVKPRQSQDVTLDCERVMEYLKSPLNGEREIGKEAVLIGVDSSESMASYELVGNGLDRFAQHLMNSFYVGVMEFNTEARLLYTPGLNQDMVMDSLIKMKPGGSTALGPALKKTADVFSGFDGKENVVYITDGITWDSHYEEHVEKLIQGRVCIYIVGLGTDVLHENRIRKIADASNNELACGGYYHAFEYELAGVLEDIYSMIKGSGSILAIEPGIDKQSFSEGEAIVLSPTIYSHYNGVELPVESNISIPSPDIDWNIFNKKAVVSSGVITNKGSGVVITNTGPGKYNLSLNMSGELCNLSAYHSQVIGVSSDERENYFLALVIIDILVLLLIFISGTRDM